MADHFIIINGQKIQLIPLGFCACGCGGKVEPYRSSNSRKSIVQGEFHKYINGHNSKGITSPAWKGGRYKSGGYIYVHQPQHPNATLDGYVLEHVLVIEKAMGKLLPPKSQGHHINHNPSDNANTNLVACEDDAYHKLLHRRERALKECGNPTWRQCNYCKQWDAPENLVVRPHPQSGVHHLECSRKYARALYWEKVLELDPS